MVCTVFPAKDFCQQFYSVVLSVPHLPWLNPLPHRVLPAAPRKAHEATCNQSFTTLSVWALSCALPFARGMQIHSFVPGNLGIYDHRIIVSFFMFFFSKLFKTKSKTKQHPGVQGSLQSNSEGPDGPRCMAREALIPLWE